MKNLKHILTFIGEKNPKYAIEKHFKNIENRDDDMNYHGENIRLDFNNMVLVASFSHGKVVGDKVQLNNVVFDHVP
jgi:hypothetical protein